MADSMRWVNALSTRPSLEAAIQDVAERAQAALQSPADLGIIFISSAFASEFSRVMPLLQEYVSVPVVIGCSGGGVVGISTEGYAQEVEANPALSLSLATLPNTDVHAFHLAADSLPDLDSSPDAWVDLIGVSPEAEPQFILMADPFSSRINDLLQGLDFAYPAAVKVGGLASASSMASSSGLFCNYDLYEAGVVGVALSGAVQLDAIVAQGCRPIGSTYRVAEGERNIILALEDPADLSQGARSPLELLQELFQSLSEEDRLLAQNSLFIGIAQSSFKQNLEQGDFLIRNLIGVDPKVGAIAIGDRVRPGQRVQFHLRDARTSAEDLEMLLQRYQTEHDANTAGALMFSCMGRGEGLYGEPNFDSQLFRQVIGKVPISGFFCGGEIGPIGGTTFLHGYTSVFGICYQP
jgi:small ligand-binding sensory domain FIST